MNRFLFFILDIKFHIVQNLRILLFIEQMDTWKISMEVMSNTNSKRWKGIDVILHPYIKKCGIKLNYFSKVKNNNSDSYGDKYFTKLHKTFRMFNMTIPNNFLWK